MPDYSPPRVEQHDYRTDEVRLVMTPQQARDLCDVLGGFGWDGSHALYDIFDALDTVLTETPNSPNRNTCPPDLAWVDSFKFNRNDEVTDA